MPIDKKNLPPKAPEEGTIAKGVRVYNTPVAKLAGIQDKLDKVTAPAGADVADQQRAERHPILSRVLAAALGGGVPLTDAEKKGFVSGAASGVTPALVAQAASLGEGIPAIVANTAVAAKGAYDTTDSSLPWWQRALGGVQAITGGAGALGGGKQFAAGRLTKPAESSQSSISQALKDYEAFRVNGGDASEMGTKFPQLAKEVKTNPGGAIAKAIYGEKGAPGALSIEEKLAQKVKDAKDLSKAEDQAVKLKNTEAAADAQVNQSGIADKVAEHKAKVKALDEEAKRVQKDAAIAKKNTASEQTQEVKNLNARDKFVARDQTQEAKNLNARGKAEDAIRQQETINAAKTGENIQAESGPVRQTAKGRGPSGESQSQTTTYREKPLDTGGEGEGAVKAAPPAPKGPIPYEDWPQHKFYSIKDAKQYAKDMGHTPETTDFDFIKDQKGNYTVVPPKTPKPVPPGTTEITPELGKALGLPPEVIPEGPVKGPETPPEAPAPKSKGKPKGPKGGGSEGGAAPANGNGGSTPPAAPPIGPASGLSPEVDAEVRKIVEEMETFGYTPKTFNPTPRGAASPGNAGHYDIVAGSGGAPVYHDIVGQGGSGTRGNVIAHGKNLLEGKVNGGGLSKTQQAIVDIAKARLEDPKSVSMPALPPEDHVPTFTKSKEQLFEDLAKEGTEPNIPGVTGPIAGQATPLTEVPFGLTSEAATTKTVEPPLNFGAPAPPKVAKFTEQGDDPAMAAMVEKLAGGPDKPPMGNGQLPNAGNGEDVLDDLLTKKYGETGLSNVNPEGNGTLPAEPPDEGAIVQNTKPEPPSFRIMGDPETGEISPLERAGEEYGIAKRLKKAGLTTEENRSGAGKRAQAAQKVAKAEDATLLQQLMQRAQSQRSGSGINFGSESGASSLPLTLRMGTGALGGIVGSRYDKDHPVEGGLVGAGAGFFGPDIASRMAPAIENQVPTMAKGVQKGMDWLNRAHNSMLLSPYSVAKKAAGDVQALVTAGILRPDRAGDIIRQLTTQEGLGQVMQNFREGAANPENPGAAGLENFINQAWNPMSWSGKTMGGLTKATKGILGEAGFTVPEQGELTMTAEPTSRLGKAIYNATRGSRIAQHFEPFMRMGVNRLERGVDYSPLGLFNPKIAESGQFVPRATKATLGTLAGAAAYNAVPDDFVKNHPIGAGMLAAGPMGIPIMTGMALKTAKGANEQGGEAFLKNTGRAAQAIEHDIPGFQLLQNVDRPEGMVRNYLSGYTNALHPITEGIKALQGDNSQADVSSKKLDLTQRLTNRMLSNIPGVEATLPRKGGSSPFGNVDLTGGALSPIFMVPNGQ